jgi:hypothetical protein
MNRDMRPTKSFQRTANISKCVCRFFVLGSICGITLLWNLPSTWAQGQTQVIAQTGQVAPDGNGTYEVVVNPTLNNLGQVSFMASLEGTSGGEWLGIFRGSGGAVDQIFRVGQTAPDGNGVFWEFDPPVMNESGQVAIWGTLNGTSGGSTDNTGIFLNSGGTISQVVREGELIPNGPGTFSVFGTVAMNNSGQVAFRSTLAGTTFGAADNSGIYLSHGGVTTEIARAFQFVPDSNGRFSTFTNPTLNDVGQTAFVSSLSATSGGSSDNLGIFRASSGGAITQIVRKGQLAADANGVYNNFSFVSPLMNNSGQVAFTSVLTGTSGGTTDNFGIFRGAGGAITQIARTGQGSPDGNGVFTTFNDYVLNDLGQVAFQGVLGGTAAGAQDNSGLFRGNGGAITQLARAGQATPNAGDLFSWFNGIDMNHTGQVAFRAGITETSSGATDKVGIYITDGQETLQVARTGVPISGGTLSFVALDRNGINEHGQVAYTAVTDTGNYQIKLWTPDLHWRASGNGFWDSENNWTLGLNPAHVHDVFIDPAASLTVQGPLASKTVRNLQIGGGSGLATLRLRNGAVLTATGAVTIEATGTLTGDGAIAGNIINNGTVLAENVTVAGTLTNNHIIHGNGRIHGSINNNTAGEIRALNGNTLRLTGPSFSNSGLVEVHGGELRVAAAFQNNPSTSLVSIRNGSFIAESGMINQGSVAVTQGFSTIRGDINNTGIIQVSGGAHATFLDDVVQNGTMQVATVGSTNSAAVILGAFTGSGGFIGGGDVFALGDLRPGNSPASVLYDGNLFLGNSTGTFIELGGLSTGEFDQMVVTCDLNLAGNLIVDLINGHSLAFNQSYLIGNIGGNLLGQFNGLGEGSLVGTFSGQDLFITYSAGGGNSIALFTAIPEPGMAWLLATGLIGLVTFSRQRRR